MYTYCSSDVTYFSSKVLSLIHCHSFHCHNIPKNINGEFHYMEAHPCFFWFLSFKKSFPTLVWLTYSHILLFCTYNLKHCPTAFNIWLCKKHWRPRSCFSKLRVVVGILKCFWAMFCCVLQRVEKNLLQIVVIIGFILQPWTSVGQPADRKGLSVHTFHFGQMKSPGLH